AQTGPVLRNGVHKTQEVDSITIRFCGDSGDGMQLAGTQSTNTSALLGNDIATFPEFPAEIRAPAGTLAGVSGFQVHFSTSALHPLAPHRSLPANPPPPAGTLAGVSGFQVHFSSSDIHTPGDVLDALVAMNPAALKTNLKDLQSGGILVVNSDGFGPSDLDK